MAAFELIQVFASNILQATALGQDRFPHQQEIDFADNRVAQVVAVLVVLELDVQAVLDANLHLRNRRQLYDTDLIMTS